jgi:YVTN family beta-propeller protein
VVTVAPNAIARLTAPEPIVTTVGGTVSVQPAIAVLGSGVTFGGTGLPPGVGVHPQSGAITGTPTTVGSYTATLTASNASGTVSTDFTVSVDPAPGNGNGLLAHYFANTTVSGTPVLTRRETPFFDYGTGGPGGGVPASNYSVRWSGQLLAQRTGSTRFRTNSDDGVRLWIGGRLVVDDWTDHPPTLAEGQVDLVAGRSYPVLLEYYNAGGGAVMQLSWSRPGDTGFAAIPVQQLSGPAALPATNLAVGKAAKQSSTYSPAVASRAVDGNTNGAFGAGSLSHTNSQANAWWQVDLGASRAIDRIRLWNRTDCCGDRLRNFHVLLSATDMTGRTLSALLADPAVIKRSVGAAVIPSNIDIQGGATARYVRVQLAGTNALQLAEVEVFGTAANRAPQITAPAAQASSAGLPVSLQIAASDPDGDALTFSATGLPPGLSINASGLISGTPTTGGSYSGTVTVRDPGGLSASAALSWSVVASAPSVTRLDVAPAAPGATVTYAPVVANDTGATYRWSYGDGVTETDFTASPGRTHVFAAPGIYGVTLTLRAASGQQSTYRFDQTITAPVAANGGGRSSGGLAFEARSGQSARLWIANPDNDSVGVIDLSTNARVAEIAVGRKPVSVALSPAGEVWVVNRESATISVVNPATLTVARTVALPPASRPYGLVFVPSSNSAIVTLEATEQVARIYYSGAFGGALSIGPSPRFLAVNGAENRIWVSRFVTPPLPGESTATVRTTDAAGNPVGGEVLAVTLNGTVERTIVLRHSEAADTEVSARGIPNYLGAVAFSPDGKSAWVPSKQDNVKRGVLRDGQGLDFQTSVRAIVSRIDVATGREDPAARVDLDNAGVASAAAFHPTGAWLFVALQTSRQVAVVDPVGKRELFRFGVGRAPSSLALSPDGRTLYVGNFMDRTVSVIGLSPLIDAGQKTVTVLATVPTIGTEKMPAAVVQGKKLFYDAADPRLARDGYLSCAACHDDAEADGRTWDFTGFGEGLRNTISLAGRAGIGHGFLHWSANFDEVQDFEGQIRNFAGGEGLMSNAAFNAGTRSQPLGDRKAGQSADLDALAAYLASRTTVPESPWRTTSGALTAAGTAGKAAFTRLGCATCHAGAKMTVSADVSALKSIGTIKPESGKRLGGPLTGIDVPTLLGVFATAPYLHDGSAATLEQAVRAHQGIAVTATDMANLVAYLGQIGSAP